MGQRVAYCAIFEC